MKGIVFSEFNEMVEANYSPDIADKIIVESDLPSGGAYTTVGTYDHEELLTLVRRLSRETDTEAAIVIRRLGRHLARRFTELYPGFFDGITSTFDFLDTIERHVHVEVRKLYPDAELPRFLTERTDENSMAMHYQSRRPFADLAQGLIEGCAEHFGDRLEITRTDSAADDLYKSSFNLKRVA
ncbi:MAG: heme NO-binding domain-containing protein [Gammaproteobacteria bacterium]|nr:heme NO-binding domain-containing protein [Gammaproteobacteria bacterium]